MTRRATMTGALVGVVACGVLTGGCSRSRTLAPIEVAPIEVAPIEVAPIEVAPIEVARVSVDGCGLAPEIATGFSVAGGLVVTNAHPLADDGPVTVDGEPARPLALDVRADVSVLAVGPGGARSPEPPLRAPVVGETVRVVRWRHHALDTATAHIVSVPTIRFHDVVAGTVVERAGAILDIAAPAGDSGSPVIGADGRVVAMVFANAHDADNQSFAISATEIATVLRAVADGSAATPQRHAC